MSLIKDVNKTKNVAPILFKSFNDSEKGIFGYREMPEDLLPSSISEGSLEHLMFITMCTSIDYQRDADQLWEAGRKTIDDDATKWIYDPESVISRSDNELITAMNKYNLSKKHEKDALKIWKPISTSFIKNFNGDPRNLFEKSDYDAQKIYYNVKGRYKRYFPYLSGNKILSLWIRMINDVLHIELKNIDKIPIPVDRHIARATLRLGLLKGTYYGDISGIFQLIDSVWAEACEDLPYYRLQLDQPLWHLSKHGCTHKKNNYCPRKAKCPVSDYCIDGEVVINDKGFITLNTNHKMNNENIKLGKPSKDYNYRWCPETGLLWTSCNCSQCIERRKGSYTSKIQSNDSPTDIEDPEFLWRAIKQYVAQRIKDRKTTMYTKSQNKRFWLISETSSYIRIKREKSIQLHEDIPKSDFIDIWKDLNGPKYISKGYTQKDLHGGQNRHTAVTFSILSDISFIETIENGRGLKYYLKKDKKR